jgi:hypothetical protein
VKVDGTVAGRDITQTTTGAGAEGAFDLQQLQSVLTELQAALDQLPDAPAGDVEDARDELRKAGEAAQQGDTDRTVKKLQGAEAILHTIGENLPAALALGQTVGLLVGKVMGIA